MIMDKNYKLYGYSKVPDDGLIELRSVSICSDAETLRAIADFIKKCADEMSAEPLWDHDHFSPGDGSCDLIVGTLLPQNRDDS